MLARWCTSEKSFGSYFEVSISKPEFCRLKLLHELGIPKYNNSSVIFFTRVDIYEVLELLRYFKVALHLVWMLHHIMFFPDYLRQFQQACFRPIVGVVFSGTLETYN